jgi:hypothetical protein
MTPAEKTRMLAERVMGWELYDFGTARLGLGNWVSNLASEGPVRSPETFNPLTNLSHAGEVLEAMRAKGWHAVMLCLASGRHYCDFYRSPTDRDSVSDGHETLSAAICHAALLAHEVKEEEL